MKPDDFEQQLKRQPLRPIPAQWREEILRAAQTELQGRAGCPQHAASSSAKPLAITWWRELLWPCPQAWAALAGIWFVILLLNLGTAEPATIKAAKARPVSISPEMLMALQEQRRFYAELIEPPQEKEEEAAPRPHTEIGLKTVYV